MVISTRQSGKKDNYYYPPQEFVEDMNRRGLEVAQKYRSMKTVMEVYSRWVVGLQEELTELRKKIAEEHQETAVVMAEMEAKMAEMKAKRTAATKKAERASKRKRKRERKRNGKGKIFDIRVNCEGGFRGWVGGAYVQEKIRVKKKNEA